METRTRRILVRLGTMAVGLLLIVAGALVSAWPVNVRALAAVVGMLVYMTAIARTFERMLPDQRRYLPLRAETEEFLNRVRELNQVALAARASGLQRDAYTGPIIQQMHEIVDRLPALAGEELRGRGGEGREGQVH